MLGRCNTPMAGGMGFFGTKPKMPSEKLPYRIIRGPLGGLYYYNSKGTKTYVPTEEKYLYEVPQHTVTTRANLNASKALMKVYRPNARR